MGRLIMKTSLRSCWRASAPTRKERDGGGGPGYPGRRSCLACPWAGMVLPFGAADGVSMRAYPKELAMVYSVVYVISIRTEITEVAQIERTYETDARSIRTRDSHRF